MKKILIAGLLCAAVSPVFAAASDVSPRVAAARAATHTANTINPVPRDEMLALLAAGITLLAYVIRNKALVANPRK